MESTPPPSVTPPEAAPNSASRSTRRMPEFKVMPPVNVFAPESVSVPASDFEMAIVPVPLSLMTPPSRVFPVPLIVSV